MSWSLDKLKNKNTGEIRYDLINDACDAHNIYDPKGNRIRTYDYSEWTGGEELSYDEIEMTDDEYDEMIGKIFPWKKKD